MIMRNSATWRWSHARHHTDTYIVGRDPEIAVMRPPELAKLIAELLRHHRRARRSCPACCRNAAVRPDAGRDDLRARKANGPRSSASRSIYVAIYAATIALAVWMGSILPLMVIGLPRHVWRLAPCDDRPAAARRAGRQRHRPPAEQPHRLMNPISRFIYWNMNYHVEHHMFPMVPYHALPRLHEMIKARSAARPTARSPRRFAEMWPALQAPAAERGLFPQARPAAHRQALPRGFPPLRSGHDAPAAAE